MSTNNADTKLDWIDEDPYLREIEALWERAKAHIDDEELHHHLIALGRKYLLLDKVAALYAEYIEHNPQSQQAKKYRDRVILITQWTYLGRVNKSENDAPRKKGCYTVLLITLLITVIFGFFLSAKIKEMYLTTWYNKANRSFLQHDLERARLWFKKIVELSPNYKDSQKKLEIIEELMDKKLSNDKKAIEEPTKKRIAKHKMK